MQAGLDSLGAMELRNALAAKFGISVPATVAFDFPTQQALVAYVQKSIAPEDVSYRQVQSYILILRVSFPSDQHTCV